MATLNVSFLNPGLRKSGSGTSVGILTDEITILENELSKDGYLSEGDYDLLLTKTREIQANPALTKAQRKNFEVRISGFEKNKAVSKSQREEDISIMNKTLLSEKADDVIIAGNNPSEFLNGRIASLKAKMDDLTEAMERRRMSGQEITDYQNEWNETINEYQSSLDAIDSASRFDGNNPIPGYAAYITTNSRGEIVDVDYARYGSKQGFVETDGMVDGFQVFGKPNAKREGQNMFILGNELFSGADIIVGDPENPGAFKPQKLVAQSRVTGTSGFKKGQAGFVNIPGGELKTQSYIPRNSWAKGVNGTIYKRRDDGGYTKYLNTDINMLPDVSEQDMLNLPQNYEQNLMRNVDETIDGAEPVIPDEGFSQAPIQLPEENFPGQPASPFLSPKQETPAPTASVGQKRAARPTEIASPGFADTAKRTIKSSLDFVKNAFS